MESNWRLNPSLLGWSYGPYGLIARRFGGAPIRWIAQRVPYDGFYDVLQSVGVNQPPAPILTVAIPALFPHFPYGNLVLPDH